MNQRVAPIQMREAVAKADGAIAVTASYAPDFERCRLLCETMDHYVSGVSAHYLLVEDKDVALFRRLETPQRIVVAESDLLPSWLRPFWDPTSLFKRRIWLSAKAQPLRGWHVQQLRRIAIARQVKEQVLVFCDSDVAFVRPFDLSAFSRQGKVRLFRRDDGLRHVDGPEHRVWHRNAAMVLGISAPEVSEHDYISTLISWRRDSVLAMCGRIEHVTGKEWVEALIADRRFSECSLYGRFVDEIEKGRGHFHGGEEFCHVQWSGEPHSDAELRELLDRMAPGQVAVGMQSFIGTDIGRMRRLVERAAAAAA